MSCCCTGRQCSDCDKRWLELPRWRNLQLQLGLRHDLYNTRFQFRYDGMPDANRRANGGCCRWCVGWANLPKRFHLLIFSRHTKSAAVRRSSDSQRYYDRLPCRSTSGGCNRWHPRWFDLPIGICLRLYRRFEHCVFLAGRQLWDRLFGVGTDCQCRRGDAGRTDLSGQYLVCL